jgi:N-acetylneuraminic acid mutarotase
MKTQPSKFTHLVNMAVPSPRMFALSCFPLPPIRTTQAPSLVRLGRAMLALILCAFVSQALAASFITGSSLNTRRSYHTATLLLNGKVLVAGGFSTNAVTSIAELYDPATGNWTTTGSLVTGRREHTTTLLSNGTVLAVGGYDSNNTFLTSAELYDPATGNWTAAGNISVRRYQHSATLLRSGQVLIAGGSSFGTYLATTELYDPATGSWTNSGRMNASHTLHTATLLPDGKVLVAGGFGTNQSSPVTPIGLTTCELYDPTSGTWTNTGSLAAARWYHMASLLPDGKVLAASGFAGSGGGFRTSAEIYDPISGTWANTGPLSIGRSEATATMLPNGTLMVIGGYNNPNTLTNAEIYNPGTGTWSSPNKMSTRRFAHTATLLANGRILVAGGDVGTGFSTNSVEVFDSDDGTWTATSSMNVQRYAHSASLLPNGKVLVAGGFTAINSGITNKVELFDPGAGTWSNTGAMSTNRGAHTATLLANGKLLVAGGETEGLIPISGAELYDWSAGTWTNTGSMNASRWGHTATLLQNGKVLVAAGIVDFSAHLTNSAELYDPAAGTWTLTGPLNYPRYSHTATLLPNGKVLVAGGGIANPIPNATSICELYDPATGTWTETGPMNVLREFHSATLLPEGRVLVAGGYNNGMTYLASAEFYDPVGGAWTNVGPIYTDFRDYHTSTLLPNGKVLVTGGNSTFGPLTTGSLYDPTKQTWGPTGFMKTNHFLHTATLLPNGKVLVAGGRYGFDALADAELYDIGLGFSHARQPVISNSTPIVNLGGILTLNGSKFRGDSEGSGGNTSHNSPADYPVVQLRSFDSGQTVFLLATSWSSSSFISSPVTGLPPDWALATVFVNGIPSASSILRLDAAAGNLIILTNPIKLAGGAFRFSFTNAPGATFTALTAINITSPPNTWTALGSVPEIAPGQYEFTDSVNTNNTQRFYTVRQP